MRPFPPGEEIDVLRPVTRIGWARVVLLCCIAALAPTIARADTATPADAAGIASAPFECPFPTHREWLGFFDGKDPSGEVSRMYGRLFDAAEYRRHCDGQQTRATRISYPSDGLRITGFLVRPMHAQGRLPVVVFLHGGVMEWGRITFADILEMHHLAGQGYLVLAPYFRGEGGSEGEPDLAKGDVDDVLNLLDLAASLPQADVDRVGLWGVSRGGNTAYRALAASGRFTAAVIVGAPADAVNAPRRAEFEQHVYPTALPGWRDRPEQALATISPLRWADKLDADAAILLLHGARDDRVPAQDSLRMAGRLQQLGRTYRLKIYEDGSHPLTENGLDVRRERDAWFDRHLRPVTPNVPVN